MGRQELSHRTLKEPLLIVNAFLKLLSFFLLAAVLLLSCGHRALAVTTEADNSELKSIIEAVRVRQYGSNKVILEFRGTRLTEPECVDVEGSAVAIDWRDIRFPRDTDKQSWWDGYEWDVIRINPKKSHVWWQKYDYQLVQRIQAVSNDKNGVRIIVTGEKPLSIESVKGMAGSDRITLTLAAKTDIVPPQPKVLRAPAKGDPLGMNSPVTLELRDVSVRDVFRMLADIRKLNLIIDTSVPGNLMTLSFKKAKFSDVFAYMLRMNNLAYALMGNTLIVGTSISISRALGKLETREYKVAYGDMAKLSAIIMSLVQIPSPPVADDRRRVLYITASPEQHIEIEALMNRIDNPGKQVMLEARLLEINDDAAQEFDVMVNAIYDGWLASYSGYYGLVAEYTDGNGTNNITGSVTKTNPSQGGIPYPGVSIGDATNPVNLADKTLHLLDAGIRALETNNKGKILANPSVVAIDGQKSTIKLTHNYMYQSGTNYNRNPVFSEQETGPTLDITPVIGRDGFVTLKLKISIGDIVQFRKSGNSEAPETTKREVDTVIRVRNGELFMIGGLHMDSNTKDVARIPIIGHIPLIGELFTSRNNRHTKSQMAFIVVPYILDVPTSPVEIYTMPGKSLIQ